MPTQGTQVYWHQLPEKQPPWRNAAELRTCIQESKHAAVSIQQTSWSGASHREKKRLRLLTEHEKTLREAKRQRHAIVQQLENPHIYRGVVPELSATPLRVVNLIMSHLGQPNVSFEEADAVVDNVIMNYNALTQQSQSQAGVMLGGGEGGAQPQRIHGESAPTRRSRGPPHRTDPDAAATASVLSQTQPTSSQTPGARGAGLATDMQNSLLLDVVGELCESRALCFKRLSRADLGSMKWQVTSVDAVPHRRVVLLADRRDPYFVVLFGLSRGVTPEPYVVAALKEDGRTPDSLQRYSRTEIPYTQVFCVAPAPVPWRRVWKNVSVSAYRNEFAVAVVEVDTVEAGKSDHEACAEPKDCRAAGGGRVSFAANGSKHLSPSHSGNGSVSPLSQHSRSRVALLGADEEDDLLRPAHPTLAHPVDPPRPTALTSLLAATSKTTLESKWISGAPMFEKDELSMSRSRLYDGGAVACEEVGYLDPLQRLPRTDARDRASNAKLRVWYRRLLPRPMESELMCRLREMHHED
ncbi:hypothetical protein ABL78_4846 [Leptomonas seymouri]|uniref:Uncharacterized protein n=1 Tax=Leptomonas seymouri TaxID=5684 RepID=A0A0N1I5S0_LEPSE|nr:hypothetical protein ABL78_4846 [Leptomonas seymouri]|eukprot:KPI86085.1 hypothetical protein ABL78_4846 [Leptomonas seymouri]